MCVYFFQRPLLNLVPACCILFVCGVFRQCSCQDAFVALSQQLQSFIFSWQKGSMSEDSMQLLIPTCFSACACVCFSRGVFFFLLSLIKSILCRPGEKTTLAGACTWGSDCWLATVIPRRHFDCGVGGQVVICQWAHKEPPYLLLFAELPHSFQLGFMNINTSRW